MAGQLLAPVTGILYHGPGSTPRGTHMMPLADLEHEHPDLYSLHRAKHDHDPQVEFTAVPPLNCTWRDVVFLTPVHPAPLWDVLIRKGWRLRPPRPWTLNAGLLDPERTIIRLMRHGKDGQYPDPADEDDYLPYTTASLRAVDRVTVTAIERLERLQPGDPVLPWVDVPHVLHLGRIPWEAFQRPIND